MYGPTENSVITTAYSVPRTFNRDNSLPIGKPVWGTDLQVRNSNGFIQPNGFIGELCISGLGLAQGYQALPETTNGAQAAPKKPGPTDPPKEMNGGIARSGAWYEVS